MKDVIEDFRRTLEDSAERLLSLTEEESEERRAPGAWSAKEIVGHLIDSAANNHGRFVRAQFRSDLVFEGYAQEEWIAAQNYQREPWPQLVGLWKLYNLHLLHVMSCAPEDELRRPRRPHSLHKIAWELVGEDEPATLEYLMRDYVGHLKHHLAQIFDERGKSPDENAPAKTATTAGESSSTKSARPKRRSPPPAPARRSSPSG